MVASVTADCPGPEAVKQPQAITPPPPGQTVGTKVFCFFTVDGTFEKG